MTGIGLSEQKSPERPVDEPLPSETWRNRMILWRCYYCGRPSDFHTCDECEDLVEERDQ